MPESEQHPTANKGVEGRQERKEEEDKKRDSGGEGGHSIQQQRRRRGTRRETMGDKLARRRTQYPTAKA